MTLNPDRQARIDEAFAEYMRLIDRDQSANVVEFLNQYADIAVELEDLIATGTQVEEMAGPIEEQPSTAALEETVLLSDTSHSGPQGDFSVDHPWIGQQLGDYRILQELGRGGMGVVYLAEQVAMGRKVALKMIRSGCLASENDVLRFHFEAQAAGKLKHHGIVQVYQVGEIEGHHFFSMEYVEGASLSRAAKQQGFSWVQIATLLEQIAEAVDFAHQHGVLHRDLKPSNILIDAHGKPKITDFGLAKDMVSEDHLTTSGSTVGTPSYMPPEQVAASRNDTTCRSDVYSLGAILYELLTGKPPFQGATLLEVLNRVIDELPDPPRNKNPNCPRDLESICLKCLEKDGENRYETASDLADDLRRFLHGERVHAAPARWYKQTWHWMRNVPFVAAAIGRKTTQPTLWHLRFQWGVITVLIALLLGFLLIPFAREQIRLSTIEISTGSETGSYHQIGEALKEDLREATGWSVATRTSAGAVESHQRLLQGEADIALLQENTLESEQLKVLAPLYREVVLVIVREELALKTVTDLAGHRVALGKPGSGMRLTSERILDYYDIEVDAIDQPYRELKKSPELHAAIVTIKPDDSEVQALLSSGEFRLLPFPEMSDPPGFRVTLLKQSEFPAGVLLEEVMLVPATFAILAVRGATPDSMVEAFLDSLYQKDGITGRFQNIFSLREASSWPDLNYHPAAQQYFAHARARLKPTPPD